MRVKRFWEKAKVSLLTAALLMGSVVPAQAAQAPFRDIDATKDAWCYNYVMNAYERGIVKGYGDRTFGKNDPTTRSQIVQILYNRFGENSGVSSNFSDIAGNEWFAKAVAWAAQNGVVSGYPDGRFGPEDTLTREQMVVVLYNHAGKPKADHAILVQYSDRDKVSAYAKDAFAWAVKNGIVNGTSDSTISPTGCATRAQMTVIFMRYIEYNIGK